MSLLYNVDVTFITAPRCNMSSSGEQGSFLKSKLKDGHELMKMELRHPSLILFFFAVNWNAAGGLPSIK